MQVRARRLSPACAQQGSSSKKRQYSCLGDESSHGCEYDPLKKSRCSAPFCPELLAADRGSFCLSCEAGRTPCPELCGRRSVPANNGYCSLCQPPTGTMRDLGIASVKMTSASSRVCSTEKCTLPPFVDSLCMHCVFGLKPCRFISCVFKTIEVLCFAFGNREYQEQKQKNMPGRSKS